MKNILKSITITAAVILAGPLGFLPHANAEQDEGPLCTLRTIKGAFGFSIEGAFLPNAFQPANSVFRAVAVTTFDGKGGMTQIDHYVVNGVPATPPDVPWPASSGTYTVNPDCTGKMILNVKGFPPFVSYFVIARGGKEIRTVLDANLVSSVGIKLD